MMMMRMMILHEIISTPSWHITSRYSQTRDRSRPDRMCPGTPGSLFGGILMIPLFLIKTQLLPFSVHIIHTWSSPAFMAFFFFQPENAWQKKNEKTGVKECWNKIQYTSVDMFWQAVIRRAKCKYDSKEWIDEQMLMVAVRVQSMQAYET